MRSHILLPHPHGRKKRVAVLCEDEADVSKAKAAGAVLAGGKELHEHLKEKKTIRKIDLVLCSLKGMKLVTPLLKTLGKRGLVPNAKQKTVFSSETIEEDVKNAVTRLVTFHTKSMPTISFSVGPLSQKTETLVENICSSAEQIWENKPSVASKRTFIKAVFIKTTHGRCIPLFIGRPPFIQKKPAK